MTRCCVVAAVAVFVAVAVALGARCISEVLWNEHRAAVAEQESAECRRLSLQLAAACERTIDLCFAGISDDTEN